LALENNVVVGHFTHRSSTCLIDEEFDALKHRLIAHTIQIPRASLQSISSQQSNEITNYIKLSKSSEILEKQTDEVSNDDWSSFVEQWSSLFKIPQMISRLSGKSDNAWMRTVFSRMYKFLLKDFDSQLEECRGIDVTFLNTNGSSTMKLHNVFVVGLEKNREVRQSLGKLRHIFKSNQVDQQFCMGELMLPFFLSREMSDRGSQFQAENELALAMKACLSCHQKFFVSKSAPKKRIAVIGITCVGSIVTGFIMRKKTVMDPDEVSLYAMQPIDSFNLMVYEDLMRLSKFLASTRSLGEELAQDARVRLKQIISGNNNNNSNNKNEKSQQQQQATSVNTSTTAAAVVNSPPSKTEQDRKQLKRKNHDQRAQVSAKKSKRESSAAHNSNNNNNNNNTTKDTGNDSDLDADDKDHVLNE
jgi:hypothetical protein